MSARDSDRVCESVRDKTSRYVITIDNIKVLFTHV